MVYSLDNMILGEMVNGDLAIVSVSLSFNTKNLIIPNHHSGKLITKIGNNAFANNNFLETVILPNTIVDIDNNAFRDCTNLQSVEIEPQDNNGCGIRIAPTAFSGCQNLERFIFQGFVHVGFGAFANCEKLADFQTKISGNIARLSFLNCKNLKAFIFHEGVTNIGENAFANCYFKNIIASGSFSWDKSFEKVLQNCQIFCPDKSCLKELAYEGFNVTCVETDELDWNYDYRNLLGTKGCRIV